MRLSMVFELLLIFLLVAFAAYARVIDRNEVTLHRVLRAASTAMKQSNMGVSTISLKQATDNVNKYCTCNDNICNCCRDFNIPVVQLKGPGCASVQYLKGDNMALQLSFGDNILTSTVVNGKSPKPVCLRLPGGFSKFCGRIYSIQREAKDHFKACLGLELESSNKVEASLRVSCFRFGPDGLKLRPAEQLPVVEADANDDDDDDDDDIFGLGAVDEDDEDDEDDDDDDDDDTPTGNAVPSSSDDEDDDEDDDDVLGLGSFFDIFGDDDTPPKKPKVTTPAPLAISIPLLTKPTVGTPALTEVSEAVNEVPAAEADAVPVEPSKEPIVEVPADVVADEVTEKVVVEDAKPAEEPTTLKTPEEPVKDAVEAAASSVEEETVVKPEEVVAAPEEAVVKPTSIVNKINTAPAKKPVAKPDPVKNEVESEEDEEEEDEDDILGTADLDEEEDDDEKEEADDDDEETETEEEEDDEEEEEKPVVNDKEKPVTSNKKPVVEDESEEESLVDDDDEEEDALISELASDDKDEKKVDKVSSNEAGNIEEDDADYEYGLAQMLARKRAQKAPKTRGRQSKVMRF